MSLLDRIAAAGGEQRAADVQPMVAAYLAPGPQAYQSAGVVPDAGTLGAWMQAQMDAANGLVIKGP